MPYFKLNYFWFCLYTSYVIFSGTHYRLESGEQTNQHEFENGCQDLVIINWPPSDKTGSK